MDTEITIETVSVSKFWSRTFEALSFQRKSNGTLCAFVRKRA